MPSRQVRGPYFTSRAREKTRDPRIHASMQKRSACSAGAEGGRISGGVLARDSRQSSSAYFSGKYDRKLDA